MQSDTVLKFRLTDERAMGCIDTVRPRSVISNLTRPTPIQWPSVAVIATTTTP